MTTMTARRQLRPVGWRLLIATAMTAGTIAAATASSMTTGVAAAANVRPNVLNIVLDDMRDQTPAQIKKYMPKTAQRFSTGEFFENAEVSTPSCCPSRATGMTGRYDHNNGMRHQQDIANVDLSTFVQHRLHLAGYQTAMAGKYVHNWPDAMAPPDFDHYAMWISPTYNDPTVFEAGTLSLVKGYATTITGTKALQYLQSMSADPAGRPWYAYVAFHAPHPDDNGNFVPESKYASSAVPSCGLSQPGEADVSDKAPYATWVKVTNAQVQATCKGQMRVLKSVDDQIDRLFAYLSSSGQLSRTMVLLWSDNGTLWGEHNRVSKFVPWLPAIDVPMWLRWDGHVPAGTSSALVSNVDIAPTIYAATGASPPPVTLDGHSLLTPWARAFELNEYWYDYPANGKIPTWAEVHDTHYAYIETYDASGARVFREYYNLDADPGELTNLLGDKSTANDPPAALLTTLAARVAAARTCVGASCP
jgi:arylsulfatase A-like enzyme